MNLDSASGEEVVVKARGNNIITAMNVLEMYKRTMKVDLEFQLRTNTVERRGEDDVLYRVTEAEISFVNVR